MDHRIDGPDEVERIEKGEYFLQVMILHAKP
jgi:hypothetical protein